MDTSRNIELHNDSPEFKLYYDLNNPRRKLITKGSYLQELGWIYEKSSYGAYSAESDRRFRRKVTDESGAK